MPAVGIVAAVGAVVGAGAAVASAVEAGKSRKALKKQYAFEQQLANNQSARRRVDTIRSARLAQGALQQTIANSGASGSSAALGALGSIQSQLNSNLSFLDTSQKLTNLAGFQASKANIAASKSSTYGAVSQLGFQIFNQAGGVGALGGKGSGG